MLRIPGGAEIIHTLVDEFELAERIRTPVDRAVSLLIIAAVGLRAVEVPRCDFSGEGLGEEVAKGDAGDIRGRKGSTRWESLPLLAALGLLWYLCSGSIGIVSVCRRGGLLAWLRDFRRRRVDHLNLRGCFRLVANILVLLLLCSRWSKLLLTWLGGPGSSLLLRLLRDPCGRLSSGGGSVVVLMGQLGALRVRRLAGLWVRDDVLDVLLCGLLVGGLALLACETGSRSCVGVLEALRRAHGGLVRRHVERRGRDYRVLGRMVESVNKVEG
jgi:hypothetical protein